MNGSSVCEGAGCRARSNNKGPNIAGPGSRICSACTRQLASDLRALPDLYHECALLLGGRSVGLRERTSGGPLPGGLPFNTAAADARDSMLAVTGAWAGLVAEECGFRPPRRSVRSLATFLIGHLDWLAAHSAAPEASEEIAGVVRAGRRAADPDTEGRVSLGQCVVDGCPGRVVALTGRRRATEVTCDADSGHRWDRRHWTRLAQRINAGSARPQRPLWLSVDEVADLWRVPSGTVYRLAKEDQWRRTKHGRRVQYQEDDVRRTMDRREGRRDGAGSAAGPER